MMNWTTTDLYSVHTSALKVCELHISALGGNRFFEGGGNVTVLVCTLGTGHSMAVWS
jgi:hypothetical protein